MKNPTRPFTIILLSLVAIFIALPLDNARAQSPAARSAFEAAGDLYMQGEYEAALAAYQQMLKDYPTDFLVPSATVQTGFANFFLGNFDEAITILEKAIKDPTTPDELKPIIAAFIPQVYAARASAMEMEDAGRKAAFETAITKFGEFIKQFPQSPQIESARYGQALSRFQIQDFDGAVTDLEENIRQFPDSPTIQDSQNLLALALATQGSKELAAGDKGDRAKGTALYDRAKGLLEGIISKQTNFALVNDARFQLAEILFSEAAFAPEEERPPLFAKAMEAYREVAPNDEMIALQEQLMAQFPDRRRLLLTNPTALQRLDREIEREQRRLGELRAKPDMIATSRMKLGEIYFNQGDLNKARVVLRHVTPFLTKEDDLKRAQYFLTLSYILQNKAPEALENYNTFQEKHKGEPIAQNLPLAMGNMFLGHPDPGVRDIDKAIQYFDESLAVYPEGSLAGLTVVSKAQAQVNLGLMTEAESTFNKFLSGDPTPQEAIVARMGLGDIYVRTQQWDKAIEAYQKIVELFPDRPQALDAKYWIAISTQQKGDNAGAIPLLQALIDENPEAHFVPNVLYVLAGAKIANGDNDGGISTLAELAEKYPDSAPAPFTFFQRAQLLTQKGEPESANDLMRQFIENYPQSDRVFAAFDWLAQGSYRSADFDGSITTYNDFIEKYPADPNAASALIRISEYSKQWAESLGRYGALTTDEQSMWQERMARSAAAAEKMIENFPESELLSQGIQNLIAAQEAMVAAELQTRNELELNLKTKAAAINDPAIRSKVLFGLASWLARQDSGRALETMQEAFDPSVIYAPSDLDTLGMALLEAGQTDEAETIFNKLLADYPNPDGVEPQNAPPLTQHAQANALFGLARVAQERGSASEAGEKFTRLKTLYEWSPKVLEADLGIAQAEVAAGQLDNALARLPGLIRSPNATADVRAKAMLLGGEIMEKRMMAANDDPKARDEALGAAIDYYIKIDQFYSGVPAIASEGLWRGAQLLERQAAGATDQDFRRRQNNLARRSYQDLINKYPSSPHVEAARTRVAAMGG
jgi:TolA-binding protein